MLVCQRYVRLLLETGDPQLAKSSSKKSSNYSLQTRDGSWREPAFWSRQVCKNRTPLDPLVYLDFHPSNAFFWRPIRFQVLAVMDPPMFSIGDSLIGTGGFEIEDLHTFTLVGKPTFDVSFWWMFGEGSFGVKQMLGVFFSPTDTRLWRPVTNFCIDRCSWFSFRFIRACFFPQKEPFFSAGKDGQLATCTLQVYDPPCLACWNLIAQNLVCWNLYSCG